MNAAQYSRLARNTEPSSDAYAAAHARIAEAREAPNHRADGFLLRLALVGFRRLTFCADQLDRVKKAVFYGKTIEWTPDELGEGLSTQGPFTPSPLAVRQGLDALPGRGMRVLHGVLGIVTEAGELAEGLVKTLLSGREIDEVNIAEEVGDVLWYVAILLDAIGLPWEPVMRANILKLARRFPQRFDGEDAILRDVGAERRVSRRPWPAPSSTTATSSARRPRPPATTATASARRST
jgi:NTP pyrophosphatase (non-canonical NTP hydrolase)